MVPRARAVTLTNYCEVARLVGLDPYAMLGRAGLHPHALSDPENWIPAQRVLDLLEDSASRSGRDDFGILIGECRTFASLGPVSLLLRHESTLRGIIGAMIEYRRLLNDILSFNLRTEGQGTVLEWNLVPGLASSQGVNLLAAIAYRVLADSSGIDWRPDCIHFRISPPAEIATFRRLFQCALEFGSGFDGMSFASGCLDLQNRFAEPELALHARRLLQLMPAVRPDETTADRTRSMIPFLIANGRANARDVADCLGMPVRTFQRRLIAEGVSFSGLLNESRRELAARYLGNSEQSVTGVAQLTGYASLSSFTRWFISEFGMPPARWRRLIRQRDGRHLAAARMVSRPLERLAS